MISVIKVMFNEFHKTIDGKTAKISVVKTTNKIADLKI